MIFNDNGSVVVVSPENNALKTSRKSDVNWLRTWRKNMWCNNDYDYDIATMKM